LACGFPATVRPHATISAPVTLIGASYFSSRAAHFRTSTGTGVRRCCGASWAATAGTDDPVTVIDPLADLILSPRDTTTASKINGSGKFVFSYLPVNRGAAIAAAAHDFCEAEERGRRFRLIADDNFDFAEQFLTKFAEVVVRKWLALGFKGGWHRIGSKGRFPLVRELCLKRNNPTKSTLFTSKCACQ
jgi:hypothetical protein